MNHLTGNETLLEALNAIIDDNTAVRNACTQLQEEIKASNDDLEASITSSNSTLQSTLTSSNQELQRSITSSNSALQSTLTSSNNELQRSITSSNSALQSTLTSSNQELQDNVRTELESALSKCESIAQSVSNDYIHKNSSFSATAVPNVFAINVSTRYARVATGQNYTISWQNDIWPKLNDALGDFVKGGSVIVSDDINATKTTSFIYPLIVYLRVSYQDNYGSKNIMLGAVPDVTTSSGSISDTDYETFESTMSVGSMRFKDMKTGDTGILSVLWDNFYLNPVSEYTLNVYATLIFSGYRTEY